MANKTTFIRRLGFLSWVIYVRFTDKITLVEVETSICFSKLRWLILGDLVKLKGVLG